MKNYIKPNWPAPTNVNAYTTTRCDGYSVGSFSSFNLASHVGDDAAAVTNNRQKLRSDLMLPCEPSWLQQNHTTIALDLDRVLSKVIVADASYTHKKEQVCVVLTADCLPVLLCDKQGSVVAAIHAGWRGLAAGIIEATIEKMAVDTEQLMVWLGPAIGSAAFIVGQDVYQVFVTHDENAAAAFASIDNNKWLADLYLLARQRLLRSGIMAIYGGEFCTYSDAQKFFSYRRDGMSTGRMASLIWLT